MAALAFLTLGGCSRRAAPAEVPLASDAEVLRRECLLSPEVTLLSLQRSCATPGTFGREGLRLVGTFQFTPAQLEEFVRTAASKGWMPGEVSAKIFDARLSSKHRPPPRELPPVKRGLSFCSVWVFSGKGMDTTKGSSPCESIDLDNKPRIDLYRAGVLDLETGVATLVRQAFY